MRFREGTPNNSLSVSPSSSSSPLFNVGYFLLPSYYYVLPGWLAGWRPGLLRLRPFDVSDPASLGVAPSNERARAGVGRSVGRTDG